MHPLNANVCQLTTVYWHAELTVIGYRVHCICTIYLIGRYLDVINNYSPIAHIGLTHLVHFVLKMSKVNF